MTDRKLARLYARIPAVEGCRKGCSDCCGPVPMTRAEAAKVRHMIRPDPGMTPTKPGCLSCAYSTPAGCSIYEARPFMCRLFGAVRDEPTLACPHGARARRPLSPAQAAALTEQYIREGERDA